MLLHALFCALITVTSTQKLTVNTTEGSIQGELVSSKEYYVFHDIPYAGDTSETNRFKAPTSPPKYPGLFEAIDRKVKCIQPTAQGMVGEENCLTLSIYTNGTNTTKPVFVFINGDEYTTNHEAPYSYSHLVKTGLLVVTMNYRLSIFGFLCLGVPEAPGNAGLKDVVQGLQWIQQNIREFGGDQNNVMLVGHGSAAAMADLITLSPLATGLVHKVVTIDGSALAPWAIAYDPVGYAEAFGAKLSYTGKTRSELASLLAHSSMMILEPALNDFIFHNNTPLFAPCIENDRLNNTFLTDSPINILRSGNYSHVPYIAGYTDYEGTIRAPQAVYSQALKIMNESFPLFLPVDLQFDSSSNKTEVVETIRNFYFKKSIDMSNVEDYIAYQGDTMILVSVIRGAIERANTSRADVRLFEFTYKGTTTEWLYQQVPLLGVRYGGFLNYMFDFELGPVGDTAVRDAVTLRYHHFAYSGVPESHPILAIWNPIDTRSNITYVMFYSGGPGPVANTSISGETQIVNPHSQRMSLWNNIYSKYYRAPISMVRSSSIRSKISNLVFCISILTWFCYL